MEAPAEMRGILMCIQCGKCDHEPKNTIDEAIDKTEAIDII